MSSIFTLSVQLVESAIACKQSQFCQGELQHPSAVLQIRCTWCDCTDEKKIN